MDGELEELYIVKRMLEKEDYGFVVRGLSEDYFLKQTIKAFNLPKDARHREAIAAVSKRIEEVSSG